jgi:hypothetical protein
VLRHAHVVPAAAQEERDVLHLLVREAGRAHARN